MHFQPGHFPFGPQKDSFYRGQFLIWPCVLIITENRTIFAHDSSFISTRDSERSQIAFQELLKIDITSTLIKDIFKVVRFLSQIK